MSDSRPLDPGPGARIHEAIERLLRAGGVDFEVVEHVAIESAEHAARVRGTPLGIGAKAIVMKLYGVGFGVLAFPADRALDNPGLRQGLGVARYRFASRDELLELTGLTPGCIPPFGRPVLDLPLYVDEGLPAVERIVFTAGTHTRSVFVAGVDWLEVAKPDRVLSFTRPREV